MHTPLPFLRTRRRNRRSLKSLLPGWHVPFTPPPSAVVAVVRVQVVADEYLHWVFDSPLSTVPADCPALEADTKDEGWMGPAAVELAAPATLLAYYPNALFPDDAGYRVLAAPAGLTFAAGLLAVPQSGPILPTG